MASNQTIVTFHFVVTRNRRAIFTSRQEEFVSVDNVPNLGCKEKLFAGSPFAGDFAFVLRKQKVIV